MRATGLWRLELRNHPALPLAGPRGGHRVAGGLVRLGAEPPQRRVAPSRARPRLHARAAASGSPSCEQRLGEAPRRLGRLLEQLLAPVEHPLGRPLLGEQLADVEVERASRMRSPRAWDPCSRAPRRARAGTPSGRSPLPSAGRAGRRRRRVGRACRRRGRGPARAPGGGWRRAPGGCARRRPGRRRARGPPSALPGAPAGPRASRAAGAGCARAA